MGTWPMEANLLPAKDEIRSRTEPHPWEVLLVQRMQGPSPALTFRAPSNARGTKQLQKTAGIFPPHPTGAKLFFFFLLISFLQNVELF